MSSVATDLISKVQAKLELAEASRKLKNLKKEDLLEIVDTNIEFHKYVSGVFKNSGIQWDELGRTARANKDPVVTKYQKGLKSKAAQAEQKRFLMSLAIANETMAEIMGEIKRKFDTIIEDETIDIYNVRVSYLATLGIIDNSEKLGNFSSYMLTYVTRMKVGELESVLPRYRLVYLETYNDAVVKIVNDMLNTTGKYSFVDDITALRRKFQDIVFGQAGTAAAMGSVLSIPLNIINWVYNIIPAIASMFTGLLDDWDDYRLSNYERKKEIKSWMEQHVALLRMDADNLDKTSPEYIRLAKIIESYDNKIADYDKEILSFENRS
jgi:hypothetical protein